MIYVALLRGINVGGKNKVGMKELKQAFERVGMTSVVTYINSGNIVFAADIHTKEQLTPILEQAIYSQFELQIKVLLYSSEEFQKINAAIPKNWSNDSQMKSDVLFLWQDVDEATVLERLVIKPQIDRVSYVPGAVLWSVDKDQVTKSGMMKVTGSALYRRITVRNVNTVRKIAALLPQA
ncbi:uncharacterized protein (DUF1697 family) [Planomicrobium stackebrandtii]|uniref:Uncharacterized protein (DUF1697 family) n=1 Tax=Planomicrobium stackebrandtii TaxID=253160 RepID=A0ABU0GV36_9BACL|nr:DUF1697 domain-containing protein [Planomicrobium stackebrandtii]MDQ0428646.1 uncharacterized protein (DUF1697 family) [Planomicrobium stackebrandtii]